MNRVRVAQIIVVALAVVLIGGLVMRACGSDDTSPRIQRIDAPAQVDPEFRQEVGGG